MVASSWLTAPSKTGDDRASILHALLPGHGPELRRRAVWSPPRRSGAEADAEYCQTVRGDRVEIVIDAGDEVRTYQVVATRNGRRVEINTGRGVVEVTEVTRSGTPVRTARFMANRVLALVEHPVMDRSIAQEVIDPDGPP
jgi:hypothetical protein